MCVISGIGHDNDSWSIGMFVETWKLDSVSQGRIDLCLSKEDSQASIPWELLEMQMSG